MLITTWTNQRVALRNCLIYNLVVLTEDGWFPVDQLDENTIDRIIALVDGNTSCPYRDQLAGLKAVFVDEDIPF